MQCSPGMLIALPQAPGHPYVSNASISTRSSDVATRAVTSVSFVSSVTRPRAR